MNADNHFLVLSAFICVHQRPNVFLPMERVPRPPLRQPILIRDRLAQQQPVLRGLSQRGEIPIALELVRWLVVMLADEFQSDWDFTIALELVRWLVVMLADVLPVGLLAET